MLSLANDLATRWHHARRAALRASLSETHPTQSEEELLALALPRDAEGALRRVFEHSKKLGDGFRSYHGLDLPIADLALLLPRLSTPCAGSTWSKTEHPLHYRSERPGCATGRSVPRACDFYREALDGLVLGLSGLAYHTRHESIGSGSERCIDVLYVHPQSPVRFGPIPEDVASGLEEVRKITRVFDSTARLDFLGVSERVLYYSLVSAPDSTNIKLTTVIERSVQRRYPGLIARDVSPRAVLADP